MELTMLTTRQTLILLILLGVAVVCVGLVRSASAAGEEVWASAYEDSPANGDSIAAGAGKIRSNRNIVRQRLEVGHFVGGTSNSLADDNGLHRLGSARCYMSEEAPTQLSDSHSEIMDGNLQDEDNIGGPGVTDLDNIASQVADETVEDDVGHGRCWIDTDGADELTNDECTAAGAATQVDPPGAHGSPVLSCCTAADTGTCDLDDNKMYIYLGVEGDAGTPPTGLLAGWQEVISSADPATQVGVVNYLTNGSFEFNATDDGTACDSTTLPSQWSTVGGSETFSYITIATEGSGCAVIVDNNSGSDGITQTLNNLQGDSDYQVTARVDAADISDICTLTITGAASQSNGALTGTVLTTITSTFTTSSAVDDVTIGLIGTDATDICTWDHVTVNKLTRVETNIAGVSDVGIISIYDTFTVVDASDANCIGLDDPIDCCLGGGGGNGDCDIDSGFQDVPELSISFNPPTPGWIVQIGASISLGCDADCNLDGGDGFTCQLEKDGTSISGTLMTVLASVIGFSSEDYSTQVTLTAIDIDPMIATPADIVYTVACKEAGDGNNIIYNWELDSGVDSQSNLWMMAYPPH